MSEMAEYFEQFPEENPANWVGERFDPAGAAAKRAQEAEVAQDSANLRAEINRIIQKHRQPPAGDSRSNKS